MHANILKIIKEKENKQLFIEQPKLHKDLSQK